MSKHRSTAWRIGILLGASGLLWGCADEKAPELATGLPSSPEVSIDGLDTGAQDGFDEQFEMFQQAVLAGDRKSVV